MREDTMIRMNQFAIGAISGAVGTNIGWIIAMIIIGRLS